MTNSWFTLIFKNQGFTGCFTAISRPTLQYDFDEVNWQLLFYVHKLTAYLIH